MSPLSDRLGALDQKVLQGDHLLGRLIGRFEAGGTRVWWLPFAAVAIPFLILRIGLWGPRPVRVTLGVYAFFFFCAAIGDIVRSRRRN